MLLLCIEKNKGKAGSFVLYIPQLVMHCLPTIISVMKINVLFVIQCLLPCIL